MQSDRLTAHGGRGLMRGVSENVEYKLTDLQCAVNEYCENYRYPSMEKFLSGPAYDLFPTDPPGKLECSSEWPDTWPNSDYAGIYAILDSNAYILYIGKSSMNSSLGARLSSYCRYGPNKSCHLKYDGWTRKPRYIYTVGVPKATSFEAPALEEFLIKSMRPPDGMEGK